ncbi:YueI family protein [Heyndrickxia sporothermodurans]
MSNQPNIDDYLQKGIYGEKQIKPEEKRKFLGTYRERVFVALKNSQVMENKVYSEIERLMKGNPQAKMLLNGELNYSFLSKYIQLAQKYNYSYSIVTNNESTTNIGLVLAHDYAINKEEIYITTTNMNQEKEKKTKEKSLFPTIKKKISKKRRT